MTRHDIENEFRGVSGLNEAKKIYKRLAKKLHPDVGGSDEEFKLLNGIYTDLVEHKIYFSNETKLCKYGFASLHDIELEKIISQILHFENITIEVVGSWISQKVLLSQTAFATFGSVVRQKLSKRA